MVWSLLSGSRLFTRSAGQTWTDRELHSRPRVHHGHKSFRNVPASPRPAAGLIHEAIAAHTKDQPQFVSDVVPLIMNVLLHRRPAGPQIEGHVLTVDQQLVFLSPGGLGVVQKMLPKFVVLVHEPKMVDKCRPCMAT